MKFDKKFKRGPGYNIEACIQACLRASRAQCQKLKKKSVGA